MFEPLCYLYVLQIVVTCSAVRFSSAMDLAYGDLRSSPETPSLAAVPAVPPSSRSGAAPPPLPSPSAGRGRSRSRERRDRDHPRERREYLERISDGVQRLGVPGFFEEARLRGTLDEARDANLRPLRLGRGNEPDDPYRFIRVPGELLIDVLVSLGRSLSLFGFAILRLTSGWTTATSMMR